MQHTHLFLPLALVSAMATVQQVYAADEFIVRDISIDGLVRLTPAQVYAALPIQSGDRVNQSNLAQAIRALYETESFDDIQAIQKEDTLLFKVIERPLISTVTLTGNKLIPKEALLEGLKKMGVAEGQVLKKSSIQTIESELEQQYVQQGRYDANINVKTTAQPNNRVALEIEFVEGSAARVVDINLIGNTVFKDSEIKQIFAVKESGWASVISKNDRYAREKMAASLEALRALYLNKGYINFDISNSSLNLSEDKTKIFIEVVLNEGEQFKFGQTKYLGDALFSENELKQLQVYQENDWYSQEKVNKVKQLLTRKYSNAGYYFAEVNIVPKINKETGTVDINYYVNPGQQVKVRRINFNGNTKTADEVLRREMRQMEGALASSEKIDLSKIRLERTGFFKTVDMKVARLPNVADEVDINVSVEEQHSGTSTLAVGFSQSGGMTFQAGLSQTNFLGTGNSVSIDLSRSETQDYYNFSVTDPYFTIDGVRRGYNMYYRKTKLDDDYNVNNYVTDSLGGGVTLGYPIDENQSISFGLNIDQTEINTGPYVSTYVNDYLKAHGDEFLTYNINMGWSYNTLNRPMFPTSGISHRINAEVALPGGDAEYQKIVYDAQAFFPLIKDFVLRGYTRLGYGNDLPFYKNFYAGGYGSVRGYENSTLGPKYQSQYDFDNNTGGTYREEVGGNALIQFGTEIVLPLPAKGDWARQVRPVLFAEGAQVFDTSCEIPKTGNSAELCKNQYDLDFNEMRYSVGVGLTWITMIGPLSISYAVPLNEKAGDETQKIQFEIGRTF